MEIFNKFYKRSIQERRQIIIDTFNHADLFSSLHQDTYDNMIENAITTYEIPFGVAPGLIINNKSYVIPMATEEPSVIAAQANAAKIIAMNGGLTAKVINKDMIGQLAFYNPKESFESILENELEVLFKIANDAKPSIVNRGGGLKKITWDTKHSDNNGSFFIIYASIDTQEAMGANIVNTIMEALKNHLEPLFEQEATMAILSNLADESLVEVECILDPSTLKNSETIADKIQEASAFAQVDPYRASTHNKGIMNGIDALTLVSGNDTRAIEAGVHAYAARSGYYKGLSQWQSINGKLHGTMTLPVSVGTVGGTIKLNPKAQLAHEILGRPTKEELMIIIAAVGLAQNFAALYALTTDGIQKGHMALQARALILDCGATTSELDVLLPKVRNLKNPDKNTIMSLLDELRQ
ncbi:hydroxymethylglutaryl-CoA reductase, degradative [Erysipelothrix urinaevulpis]|uniref:hydroxymethylglutaryl-CoA reductase, degradative n=1 Tax=Erysipelothrix urinaevulpis TaxID=2683717 RepID=UPI00135BF604|nr:hydroxymethylglutaryl-CoA reductase, degradative [Erysipelothrix urinaevulpis]